MRTLLGQSVPNIATDADFPDGTFKDDSPLGSGNGTPLTEKAGIPDLYNASLALMNLAGLVPNEEAEKQTYNINQGTPQIVDALQRLFARRKYDPFYGFKWALDGVPFGDLHNGSVTFSLVNNFVTIEIHGSIKDTPIYTAVAPGSGALSIVLYKKDGTPFDITSLGDLAYLRPSTLTRISFIACDVDGTHKNQWARVDEVGTNLVITLREAYSFDPFNILTGETVGIFSGSHTSYFSSTGPQ